MVLLNTLPEQLTTEAVALTKPSSGYGFQW
jgi:hypothetical protein